MIPAPSKRPFQFKLPPEALAYFCHPTRAGFTAPMRHPGDGLIYAASGYVCLRAEPVRAVHAFAEDYEEMPAEIAEKLDKLPWRNFHKLPGHIGAPEWRSMDNSRGTIYGGGPLPLWVEHRGKPPEYNRDTLVRTADGPLVPLAMLQLLARLPRPEVKMNGGSYNSSLLVRFAGEGQAIVPPLYPDNPPPFKFQLFKAKEDNLGLQPFKF
jgi:hypothetical protein